MTVQGTGGSREGSSFNLHLEDFGMGLEDRLKWMK